MKIEVTAYAPTREAGIAFMEACGIAALDKDGTIIPIVEAHIHPTRPEEEINVPGVPGWHCNVLYYGQTAANLTEGLDQSSPDLFERTRILDLVDARTGEPLKWTALAGDKIPPGYENADGVRLFDPSLISTRVNVWA